MISPGVGLGCKKAMVFLPLGPHQRATALRILFESLGVLRFGILLSTSQRRDAA